jgi:hypothetical protein
VSVVADFTGFSIRRVWAAPAFSRCAGSARYGAEVTSFCKCKEILQRFYNAEFDRQMRKIACPDDKRDDGGEAIPSPWPGHVLFSAVMSRNFTLILSA